MQSIHQSINRMNEHYCESMSIYQSINRSIHGPESYFKIQSINQCINSSTSHILKSNQSINQSGASAYLFLLILPGCPKFMKRPAAPSLRSICKFPIRHFISSLPHRLGSINNRHRTWHSTKKQRCLLNTLNDRSVVAASRGGADSVLGDGVMFFGAVYKGRRVGNRSISHTHVKVPLGWGGCQNTRTDTRELARGAFSPLIPFHDRSGGKATDNDNEEGEKDETPWWLGWDLKTTLFGIELQSLDAGGLLTIRSAHYPVNKAANKKVANEPISNVFNYFFMQKKQKNSMNFPKFFAYITWPELVSVRRHSDPKTQSMDQWINGSMDQWINGSIVHSTNLSIN